jgi:hypothetical protein
LLFYPHPKALLLARKHGNSILAVRFCAMYGKLTEEL